MKTSLVILVLSVAMLGYSQPGRSILGVEEYPANIDSIVYYNYSINDSTFVYAYTNSYLYEEDRIVEIFSKSSITGVPISRANYYFNSDGYVIEYTYYLWQNGNFVNSFRQTYRYNSKNLLEEFISYIWTNGDWKFNNRYVHFYTNDTLVYIDIYSPDANGIIILKNKRFYEYEAGLLKRYYTIRISDGVIMSTSNYAYDTNGKIISKIDEALIYDKILKKYILAPSSRNTYFYDNFSLLREIVTENWSSDNWKYKQKMVYYYRIDSSKKVAICHNNKTIVVSVNSLPAHLSHGDVMGKCTIQKNISNKTKFNIKSDKTYLSKISAFPNPATTISTISGLNNDVIRIDLISQTGKVVKTINNFGNESITITRDELPAGFYLVKVLYQDNSVQTIKLFFQ